MVYVSVDHRHGVHPLTLQLRGAHRPRPDLVREERCARAPRPPTGRVRAAGAVDARDQDSQALSPSPRLPTGYRAASSAVRVWICPLVHQALLDTDILGAGVGLAPGGGSTTCS